MTETRQLFEKAIEIVGGRRVMAEKLGKTVAYIGQVLNGKTPIQAEIAMSIQVLTKNAVTAQELRPDLPWKEVRRPKRT